MDAALVADMTVDLADFLATFGESATYRPVAGGQDVSLTAAIVRRQQEGALQTSSAQWQFFLDHVVVAVADIPSPAAADQIIIGSAVWRVREIEKFPGAVYWRLACTNDERRIF